MVDNQAYTREEAESAIKALRGRVGRYVVASTVSTYGEGGHAVRRSTVTNPVTDADRFWVDHRSIQPVREEDSDVSGYPWEYRSNLSKYGEGKRHVERVNLESQKDWQYVVIRVPATLGPDDPTGRFAWWLWRILDGGPILLPDGGKNAAQLGYSRDLAQFILDCAATRGTERNVFNYAQRELPAWSRYLEIMAKAAGKELRTVAVPSEMLHRHSGLPWHEWGYAPFCDLNVTMSLSKAERMVGLPGTPLTEWVKSTTDWYLAHPESLQGTRFSELRNPEVQFAERYAAAVSQMHSALEQDQ